MANSPVISMLSKKYAKLLGEYEFAERMTEDAFGLNAIIEATNRCDQRKKEIDEKLAAIETVIWMFDPDWNPATVRPNYPRKKHLKPGAISRTAYAVLREANASMTSREIARVVASRLGYENLDEREMNRIDIAVFTSLSRHVGKTIEITTYNPTRWTIISMEQVTLNSKPRTTQADDTRSLPRESLAKSPMRKAG